MARALSCRQFEVLLEEFQAEFKCLLMYNNVRWLIRERVMKRAVAGLDDIMPLMNEKGKISTAR